MASSRSRKPRKGTRLCQGPCGRNRDLKFFKPRGRICSTCQRNSRRKTANALHVLNTYGIEPEILEAMYQAQNGCCAICGKKRSRLEVDHDHAVEKEEGTRASVRGLLCRMCNGHLLPACRDNPEILKSALEYLTNPPARSFL